MMAVRRGPGVLTHHGSWVMIAVIAIELLFATDALAQAPPTYPAVPYATVGGEPLLLDIYLPTSAGDPPYPVVLWIHGGGWHGGNRSGVHGLDLLAHGVAVASIDYRLTSQAGEWGDASVIFPAQIHDVKAAVRFLRAEQNATTFQLDPCRVGAWGSSAGGHLAALLAVTNDVPELEGMVGAHPAQTSRILVACDYFGPSDLMYVNEDVTYPPGNLFDHDAPDSPESRLIGWDEPGQGIGDIKANIDNPNPPYPNLVRRVFAASPLRNVSPSDPPLFIAHGDQDTSVPLNQSIRLAEAYQHAGAPHELVVVAGAGHGALGPDTYNAAIAFLVAQLTESDCRCTNDLDDDGGVSASDLTLLLPCLTGPGGTRAPDCRNSDLDWDTDVDLHDYGRLQRAVGTNGC